MRDTTWRSYSTEDFAPDAIRWQLAAKVSSTAFCSLARRQLGLRNRPGKGAWRAGEARVKLGGDGKANAGNLAESNRAVQAGRQDIPGYFVRQNYVQKKVACNCDAPYRLAKQYDRLGIAMSRSTLTDLFHAAAIKLEPLYKRLLAIVAASEIVQADETSLKMQRPSKLVLQPCHQRGWPHSRRMYRVEHEVRARHIVRTDEHLAIHCSLESQDVLVILGGL